MKHDFPFINIRNIPREVLKTLSDSVPGLYTYTEAL